jgi:hypothetical protein
MQAAGLNWRVKKVPVYAGDETALVPMTSRFAVVPEDRWGSDTCPVFGLVGKEYVPLQNEEAFGFFDRSSV